MDDDKNVLTQAAAGDGKQNSRHAIRAFIMANVALFGIIASQLVPFFVFLYLAFPFAIAFGHLGKRDIRREPEKYAGFAMAQYGLMVGYFFLLITIIVLVALVRGYRPGA
jgi:hypothetical protein